MTPELKERPEEVDGVFHAVFTRKSKLWLEIAVNDAITAKEEAIREQAWFINSHITSDPGELTNALSHLNSLYWDLWKLNKAKSELDAAVDIQEASS